MSTTGAGTEVTGLIWGVKASFRDYVKGVSGTVGGTAPIVDGGFVFSHRSGLHFSGAVTFRAHGGMLDVTLADPAIEGGVLSVFDGTERIRVARLDWGEPEVVNGRSIWKQVRATLTTHGSHLLGGSYAVGTELDRLSVDIPAEAR